MERSASHRLNPTDATLWQIQRDPLLRTTIVGLADLDRRPEWDRLVATVRAAVDRLPRLRQRVVDGPLGFGRPHWADAELEWEHHLVRTELADLGDRRHLLDVVGRLASTDLDLERPLWELHLLHDASPNAAALVFKLSHSLTDGVGGMELLRIFDDAWDPTASHSTRPGPASDRSSDHGPASIDLVATIARSGLHPLDATSNARSLAESAVRLLAPAGPPLSPLMTGRGLDRWTGTTEIRLDRLRAAAHRAGGTINDAFVTIAIGALDDHHRRNDCPSQGFRITMPVDTRRSGDVAGGNQWAPARLVLHPSTAEHPFAALQDYRATVAAAVHEPAIPFVQPIAAAVQQLPDAWTTSIVANMVKGSDIALTNVPGRVASLTIAGADVTRFFPFAPTGGAAVNIGLVSHLDTACVGFNVDAEAITDPEALVDSFDERANDFLRRRRRPHADATSGPGPRTDDLADDHVDAGRRPSAMPRHERLSALDTSFLRMETPATPMHMGGLFVIDGSALVNDAGRLDLEQLRRHIDERLDGAPHLRRRLGELPLGLGRPVWLDDPGFDIAHHVHRQTLAAPGGRAQLLAACEHLQMVPLDRRRALFELTFFDGLDPDEFGTGAIALIDRVHHALLDGVAGLEMVRVICDDASIRLGERDAMHRVAIATDPPPPSPLRLVSDTVLERWSEPLALGRMGVSLVMHPRRTRELASVVTESARNLVARGSGLSELNAPTGRHRRLETITVPLDDIHQIGAQLGGSINDVVLVAVANGIAAALRSRGERVGGSLNILVPVSTHEPDHESGSGNHVAAIVVDVPLGERLSTMFEAVTKSTSGLKRRGTARGSAPLLDAANALAPPAITAMSRAVRHQRWVNLVVTNIHGPTTPLTFLGGEVRELVPIVPLGANLTLGVAVLSYGEHLTLAFHADRARWTDLDVVASATAASFDQLTALGRRRPRSSGSGA